MDSASVDAGAEALAYRAAPDFSNWSCPLPLAGYLTIVMGHGGGASWATNWSNICFCPLPQSRS